MVVRYSFPSVAMLIALLVGCQSADDEIAQFELSGNNPVLPSGDDPARTADPTAIPSNLGGAPGPGPDSDPAVIPSGDPTPGTAPLSGGNRAPVGNAPAKLVMDQMFQQLEVIVESFESVNDKATAKAAAVRINQVCDALPRIASRAQRIRISKEAQVTLERDFKKRMQGLEIRMQTAALSAGRNCEGEASFLRALQRMQAVGTSLQQMQFQVR